MSRRALALLFLCLLLPAAGRAQPVDEAEFPTLAALREAEIPFRDRYDLARRYLGVIDAPTPAPAPPRQIGDRETFIATNILTEELVRVDAELQMIGDHIYLWVEAGQPFDEARLKALAQQFDSYVYEETRALWGSEALPGIDGDPRIHGLFASAVAGVTAYFQSDQSYPRAIAPISNEREMFFFSLSGLNSTASIDSLASIIAHEFQHMIRYHQNPHGEVWLNEGLSEFTQSLLFGDASLAAQIFLNQPDTQLNNWSDDIALRTFDYGASLAFMLYIHERYGLETVIDIARYDTPRALDAIDSVLRARGEAGADEFFADFALANALMDAGLEDGRYAYAITEPPITAFVEAVVADYPASITGTVAQYGADYVAARSLPSARLNIALDVPAVAPLITPRPDGDSQFWYSNRLDLSATRLTGAFDLTGVSSAALSYDIWHDFEAGWDYGYLSVSADGGASWSLLQAPGMTDSNPHGVAYGTGYTGQSGGWVTETVSLDAYAGRSILLRFEAITDDGVNRPGMAVDNLRIDAIGFVDDVEAGAGDWQAEGWLITDNRLPQIGWLQAVITSPAGREIHRWRFPDDGARWTLDLPPNTQEVLFALSGTAPVTTARMPYTLTIAPG
jgi:hypothetical protein